MCVRPQGLPTAILKVFVELSTSVAGVTRSDQKTMKRAVSVAFIKLRSRVSTLAATHKAAIETMQAKGDDESDDAWGWYIKSGN